MSEETKKEEIKTEETKEEVKKELPQNAIKFPQNNASEEVDVSDDELELIKKNVSKVSQFLQILGQTTEQFELAKANIIDKIAEGRQEHEKVTSLLVTKNGFDKDARIVDVNYEKKKIKILGKKVVNNG